MDVANGNRICRIYRVCCICRIYRVCRRCRIGRVCHIYHICRICRMVRACRMSHRSYMLHGSYRSHMSHISQIQSRGIASRINPHNMHLQHTKSLHLHTHTSTRMEPKYTICTNAKSGNCVSHKPTQHASTTHKTFTFTHPHQYTHGAPVHDMHKCKVGEVRLA